jgi:hypothetical protein
MSGQPLKTPSDAQKYRDAYMANLNLQIKNNDKNLQANKLHQRTGVPATQISDYRTTSEKLADIESLRTLVRNELLQIADSINAQNIVQKMSVDELRFVAQNIDMIVRDVKPKNKFGVLEPIFRAYLVAQMNAQMKAEANVAGIMLENRGVSSLASLKQLETEVVSSDDIGQVLQQVGAVPYKEQLIAMATYVAKMLSFLTPQFYKRLESIPDYTERVAALEKVAISIRELPSKKQLQEQVGLINRARGNEQAERVAELIEMLDVPSLQLLEGVEQEVPNKATKFEDPRVFEKDLTKKRMMEIIAPYAAKHGYEDLFAMSASRFSALRVDDMRGVIRNRLDVLMQYYQDELVEETVQPQLAKSDVFKRTAAPPSREYSEHTQAVQRSVVRMREEDVRRQAGNEESAIAKYKQLQGRRVFEGLSRNIQLKKEQRSAEAITGVLKKVGRQKKEEKQKQESAAVKVTEAVRRVGQKKKAVVVGVGFGKYFINEDKLKDDVVSIRSKNGRNHPNMPTKRVSKGLGKVLRHIAGGANPSYDDLHRLSDEDRTHLSDLVRTCKVDVSVPEGSDKDDLHQFDILQGELGAGNDSPELVKKLKGVIMRLMNKGRLPKGQGREILTDLVALGY